MEDEITGREPVVEQVKATGQEMVENGHYASDTITSRLSNLDNKWASARDTAAYRKRKLQDSLNVQQVQLHDECSMFAPLICTLPAPSQLILPYFFFSLLLTTMTSYPG
jgi:hypothetical protein